MPDAASGNGDGEVTATPRVKQTSLAAGRQWLADKRNRPDDMPWEWLLLGVALLLLGSAFITVGVRQVEFAAGLLGIAVAAGGLAVIDVLVRLESTEHPGPSMVVGLLIAVVGTAVVIRAFADNSALLAGLGALLTVIGVMPLSSLFSIWSRRAGKPWLAPTGVALIVLGGALVPRGWIAPAAVGLLLVLVGVVAYRLGIRRTDRAPNVLRFQAAIGCMSTVLGFVVIVVASLGGRYALGNDVLLAAVGAGLFVLGLMAFSVAWPSLDMWALTPVAAIVLGVLVVGLGTTMANATVLRTDLLGALFFAVVVAALGMAFVWRGAGLVVAVLVGTSMVWLTFDRVDDIPSDPNPTAQDRILALGDSYISGEGAPHYFEGTNVRKGAGNECRRSTTAYPYILASETGMGLDFLACSGAKAGQLHLPPEKATDAGPQLGNLPRDVGRIKLVIVSTGGNDSGFGDIGKGCVIPGSCDALRDLWLTNLDQVSGRLVEAFAAIKKRLPSVPVVAMPYPLMIEDDTCAWSRLDRSEHQFVSQFVVLLNDRVRVAANRAGVHFFGEGMFTFDGKKICDGKGSADTVMNFINLNPVQGSFLERMNPRNWITGACTPSRPDIL